MNNIEGNNGAKHSLLSDNSVTSLYEDQGIVVENYDGTYYHGVRVRKIQGDEENKNSENNAGYPRNRIIYVVDEDEIALYARFSDLPTRVDEFIELMMIHQKYFVIFLIVFFVLEVITLLASLSNMDDEVKELRIAYKGTNTDFFTGFYYFGVIVELIFQIIYYTCGLFAIINKTIKSYRRFVLVSLIGMVLQMVMSFANRFAISSFLLRFFGLVYGRFINQLMMSLLLLPR